MLDAHLGSGSLSGESVETKARSLATESFSLLSSIKGCRPEVARLEEASSCKAREGPKDELDITATQYQSSDPLAARLNLSEPPEGLGSHVILNSLHLFGSV